jgi:hypothetical protein
MGLLAGFNHLEHLVAHLLRHAGGDPLAAEHFMRGHRRYEECILRHEEVHHLLVDEVSMLDRPNAAFEGALACPGGVDMG